MKASSILVTAVAGLALTGCVIAIDGDKGSHSKSYTSGSHIGYASVYAADIGTDAITFTVSDNGCTDENFFDIDVRKIDDYEFSIGLTRTREDYCQAGTSGKNVSWSYRELGIPDGASVSVLNGIRR